MYELKIKNELSNRAAGILLPVSSLPSPYGIGSCGKAAYAWVDFLAESGQRYWQVLPLGPTGYADSPYQSFSAFAGNPYFIDLDLLCEAGLLKKSECKKILWTKNESSVDYGILFKNRETLLWKAFLSFNSISKNCDGSLYNHADFKIFCEREQFWLDDYSLYMAIKKEKKLKSWTEWPKNIRLRNPESLSTCRNQHAQDILFYHFLQYLFFKQWSDLKNYANRKGVGIIGDIPIYVSMDSADAWSMSEMFELDTDGKPLRVAGCPPDAFSEEGQLWGNPLYRWDVMKKDDYKWWRQRIRACFLQFDILRIDHFRGLESYYAIPGGSKNAVHGEWEKGPGMDFIRALQNDFPDAKIIAEDLGFLTQKVHKLREKSGYPGMKVLQFAFDSREESDYLPYRYNRDCVVYTGTHDNETTFGWFGQAAPEDIAFAFSYLGTKDRHKATDAMIRTALSSVANLAVVPLQDYLHLDCEARINTPATVGGNNWCWRVLPGMLTEKLSGHILEMTAAYGRCERKTKAG